MSDVFGALTLPTTTPATGVLPGFPELVYIAEFCKAVLNSLAHDDWAAVSKHAEPCPYVFTHDPQILFDDVRLPALYCYCGEQEFDKPYDGVEVMHTTVELKWIMEPAQENSAIQRSPAVSMVARILSQRLTVERDPSWKVTGDTDPFVTEFGSSLTKYCGICSPITPGKFKPFVVDLPLLGDAHKTDCFTGVTGSVSFDLLFSPGNPASVKASKLDATITENPDVPAGHFFAGGTFAASISITDPSLAPTDSLAFS